MIKNKLHMVRNKLSHYYSHLISFFVYHFESWLWRDVQPVRIYKFYSETTGEYCEARKER